MKPAAESGGQAGVSDADPDALSIAAALQRLRDQLPCISELERVPLSEALGRIAAEQVDALVATPPFRASAMDGYAFRHTEGSHVLRVAESSMAGHPGPDRLAPGSCQRITTGARVPDEADTVVMQENTTLVGDRLRIDRLPAPGFNVRTAGSDVQRGRTLVNVGQPLRASSLGLLGACGHASVNVLRRVKVAILSTGDELVEPGQPLAAGQIHDANRLLLRALLTSQAIEIVDIGISNDTIDALREAIDMVADADLIVSSGGVSVGDADFVRTVIDQQGTLALWKIAMKPGRPLTFGILDARQAWMGLPGNPVSAAVTCLMFVKPALEHMTGQAVSPRFTVSARLASPLRKLPGRVEYQRGVLQPDGNGGFAVQTTGLQDSHVLTSLLEANCFIELPMDSSGAEIGESVTTIPFNSFLTVQV